ncbi:MAG: FkbM family methyltransferase [Acidilobus sp.]
MIAVEPLPNIARCAEESVRLSGATDKVKVINAALSDEPVSVPCDYDVLSSRAFSTLSSSGSCKVPGVTLGDLLNMVEDPYLLKMDCEGCEAQVILGSERERLRAFKHIILETHPTLLASAMISYLSHLRNWVLSADHPYYMIQSYTSVRITVRTLSQGSLTERFEDLRNYNAEPSRYKQYGVAQLR